MKNIFYIHGLGSNGNGTSARNLQKFLGNGYRVVSPDVPFDPDEAMTMIRECLAKTPYDCVIGTSLGGFYALKVTSVPLILAVNPALHAAADLRDRIGMGTYEYFNERENGDKTYTIDEAYLKKLRDVEELEPSADGDRQTVIGLFGEFDELLNHRDEFRERYAAVCPDRFRLMPCGHRMTEEIVRDVIAPCLRSELKQR